MRQAVIGMLAHVDAGKTTLAEALLYQAGALRRLGRVDHGDAFLDSDEMERRRGITIFSKQAVLEYDGVRISLLDAPGHTDFSAEAERTLQALDYAIVVVGAVDGVQAHTETLWRLLAHHSIPTFVFANKMDLPGADRETLLAELRGRLGDGCFDAATLWDAATQEALAMTDEGALEEYLARGGLTPTTIRSLVTRRLIFPCFFGSALRMEGVDTFLDGMVGLLADREWPSEFAARVFKVSHGSQGERLAWLKVTGGILRAKDLLEGVSHVMAGHLGAGREVRWSEKVNQIRLYSGTRYETVAQVEAGGVCAVTGLTHVYPGDVLGAEPAGEFPRLSPVLTHRVQGEGCDIHAVHTALRVLAQEDPLLGVTWREDLQELHVQLMGTIQREVLCDVLNRRFGLAVSFGPGGILYKETIAAPMEGVGHFEPLRHYAEVHLLLEPLERGSGVVFGTVCGEDDLDRNWQRLILTNAMEREHRGVLVGAPLTDVRITLVGGRAHPRHTEGGDFRQATYRAVRQALMRAHSVLLEPWYHFVLEVPATCIGRALSDAQRMCATFETPHVVGDMARIVGRIPASEVGDYAVVVGSYTSGRGRLRCEFAGYDACHDLERVVAEAGYDPELDLANTADSVFCSHGAGHTVRWPDVAAAAHVDVGSLRRHPWRAADAAFFADA